MTETKSTFSPGLIHQEQVLEDHLVTQLVQHQGYLRRSPSHYDRSLALDRELVLQFVQSTQANQWQRLVSQYASSAETEFFKQLEKNLKDHGTLAVLRNGIKLIPGIHLRLCYFQPASNLNPDLVQKYEANILSAIRQVAYSQKNNNELDVVLFVNGLPVATLELKNLLTDSTVKHAEKQYRTDRSPAGEPLLTFKRGALVHFALDEENVSMTTRLQNGKTTFLPFNRGHNGGAGNPPFPNEHPIAYLYNDISPLPRTGEGLGVREVLGEVSGVRAVAAEGLGLREVTGDETANEIPPLPRTGEGPGVREVGRARPQTITKTAIFGRQTWLAILGKFVHLERTDGNEKLLFPRYQQLDAVRTILDDARHHGPGQNYLIQHSAGSGKSNTIAWTAHQIINLHDDHDTALFDTAIIVTDRIVLDKQLQDTVAGLEQTAGVVKKIDGTSRQLKDAINDGARIIISTIQKFGTEHLKEVSAQTGRNFALIIDEAHSSQSGKSAQSMTEALTKSAESSDDIEDLIAAFQHNRGPQPNISYFAFTATPRNVTLERFGRIGTDGLPHPFHLYSMRQAIEEGFILDVLQHFSTYRAYYELEKAVESDPQFKTKKAQRKVAKYAHLHPTAIDQKVEVMVEHFRRHVKHEIDDQAKAMVVTASREAALRYYFGMRDYIKKLGYTDVRPLVAFSGDLTLDGLTWSEGSVNGFPDSQTAHRFDTEVFNVLIVAEKYQTGFDQPRLCAMYVDRKLAGLQAVQTLSRLNRVAPGKASTWVLDFQNSIEDIQEAFKPYFKTTELDEPSDPNQIYELQTRLWQAGVLDRNEIDAFASSYFQQTLTPSDRVRLEGLVRQAVARFETLDDDKAQEEFRQLLKSFLRFYAFVSQIVQLQDTDLEKLSVYGDWLRRMLPGRVVPPEIEVTDEMLRLHAFKLQQMEEEQDASLAAGDTETIRGIHEFAASYNADEEKSLSEIIQTFNDRYGTDFTKEDFLRFEQVNRDIMDENMIEMLKNNPPDVVFNAFSDAFFTGAIKLFARDAEMKSIVLSDADARERAIRHFFNRALRQVSASP